MDFYEKIHHLQKGTRAILLLPGDFPLCLGVLKKDLWMKKERFKFVCQGCGQDSKKWLGRCPSCGEFNTFVEEYLHDEKTKQLTSFSADKPKPITEINTLSTFKKKLPSDELNRVLGDGITDGSLVLVGGEPGIGKSTLLLQVSNFISNKFGKVLYVSGEESPQQVRLRAERLNCLAKNLFFVSETDIQKIISYIQDIKPCFVVIDSIQTIFHPDIPSSCGSIGQIKECTNYLCQIAKRENISIFIIGHVTKEGNIAGPKVLEHIVDTVLYFEGERYHTFRILRCVKNRFGSTSEVGLFEMREDGLHDVKNPSDIFLTKREGNISGFCIASILEGTRPIAMEVQALVSYCGIGIPRRTCQGIDYNRLSLILAVLEKRVNFNFSHQDVYVNLPGGIKTDDVSVDMGVAISIASSLKDKPVSEKTIVMGEIGLTGEIRDVSSCERRLREAERLGFEKAILPWETLQKMKYKENKLEIIPVKTIKEALKEIKLI